MRLKVLKSLWVKPRARHVLVGGRRTSLSLQPDFRSPERATVASITDTDDTVTAMIYRHAEPMVPEADLSLLVISVDGDVECDAAAYLDHILQQAMKDGTPVCCDLTRTEFFGAAGATVALYAAHRAAEAGSVFLLRGVHGISALVLEVVGFDQSLIITTDP
jgi:anti-anti-sigma regulatory factor